MHADMLLLGTGQLALAVGVCYLLYLLRRDARRSSLVNLLTVLNDLREKNAKALAAVFALTSSEAFKSSDDQVRDNLLDSTNRLRAIQDAVTEALLQTLRQCDSEWRLAGRLHSAIRSQLDTDAARKWERELAQHAVPQKGCA
jgi:hypothetical protein